MIVKEKNFRELVPIGKTLFYDLKKVVDIDKLFKLFACKQLTTNEKKTILYKSTKLTKSQKDTMWKAYTQGEELEGF